MGKIMKLIGDFEIRLRDEFGIPVFKSKGKPKKITDDIEEFFKIKGLSNVRTRNKRH